MEQSVEFDKERSLSELVDDSYRYIKQNFKEMVTKLAISAGPFLLISQAFALKISPEVAEESSLMSMLNLLLSFSAQAVSYTVIYSYILITAKGEEYTNDVMWDCVKKYFFLMLSTFASVVITTMLGIWLLILPGIFILVPLSMMYIHRLLTGQNFFESIQFLLALVRNNWWNTFITFLITSFVLVLVGGVFAIPYIQSLYATEPLSVSDSIVISITMSIFHIITTLFAVPATLQYYNLLRKRQ